MRILRREPSALSLPSNFRVGCHCWLAQQCNTAGQALLDKPAVAPELLAVTKH